MSAIRRAPFDNDKTHINLLSSEVVLVKHIAVLVPVYSSERKGGISINSLLMPNISVPIRLVSWWREGQVFVHVIFVSASNRLLLELGQEGLVEVQDIVVGFHKAVRWNFLADTQELSDAWIVDHVARKVKVLLVLLIKHLRGNIWDITASVRFALHGSLAVKRRPPEKFRLTVT